jgi:hypothetical protein
MPKTKASLVWKTDDVFNTYFSAQVANVTYYVVSRIYGADLGGPLASQPDTIKDGVARIPSALEGRSARGRVSANSSQASAKPEPAMDASA